MRAMLDEPGIRTAAVEHPEACTEFFWGKRLACVEIDLARAGTDLLRRLLTEAWSFKTRG
jgi:hypothetical protein